MNDYSECRFMKILFIAALAVCLGQFGARGEIPVYENQPSGEYFETWLLCGPFPNPAFPDGEKHHEEHLPQFNTDYLAGMGGEIAPDISEGKTVTYGDRTAVWVRHTASGGIVDLDRVLSQDDFILAYAYCEFVAPQEQACMLAVGSNDGVRVWLNGKPVYDRPRGGKMIQDGDLIPVVIPEGRSTLLLKIEERGGKWEFCCRLLPLDDRRFVVDRLNLFRVVTRTSGQAAFCAEGAIPFYDRFIRKVHLEAVSESESSTVLWQKDWTGEEEILIDIPQEEFHKYLLRVSVLYVDNKTRILEFPFAIGKPNPHTLFEDGKSDYAIVLGENASESERWAAMELRYWIKEVGDVDLPILSDSSEPQKCEIVVGFNDHARRILGSDVSQPKDLDESFTYRNVGPHIVIWGGRQRGTMYGVVTFLEREMGCRWYAPGASTAPKKRTYSFIELSHSESPAIPVRFDDYFEARDPLWAARNRCNGAGAFRNQPGGVEVYYECHTFYKLMPPSEFFDKHPEYYSLINGKREHERGQLCLTNPDVLRIFTDRVREELRKHPYARIYSVSQNDWQGPCECENCRAIVEREGSQSGPMVWFANRVAENIEGEFPDRMIGTFAYDYTRKPPKEIRPRHNVVIRLCSIECCFSHPFNNCPLNTSFMEDLRRWSEIAPHLYIWDYVVNFHYNIMPFPNFAVLQPNIRTLRDHKAIGIMTQAANTSRGAEFEELRMYLIAKLLWNPDIDLEPVIDDFMAGFYGRSGPYIRQYFDLMQGLVTPDRHFYWWLEPEDPLYSEGFIREAEAIFDQAERIA
ncbi:MAG TPA: DUF4838 domain-containing protein, partial [bacterium]|nr:DUF4838 domain-containing protein [bacterium]